MICDEQRRSRGHKVRGQGHKKIRGQGQGQPFRGQTLSRPRTGMLEAKVIRTKDTSASALQKKKKRSSQKFFGRSQKKKIKVLTKIFQAISTKKRFPKIFSSTPQNFTNSKISAVLKPRTGQFSRTWGLEVKAKDLTFEAKAKGCKMCPRGRPRGQGRARGLHLWWWEQQSTPTTKEVARDKNNNFCSFKTYLI